MSKFEIIQNLPLYRLPVQHGAAVEIGRRLDHGGRVWPRVFARKWRGESWLSISAANVEPRPGRPARLLANDTILEIDCERKVARGGVQGETHRLTVGSLKWDVIYNSLADMPEEGYAAFDLSLSPGLEAHYQPELTPDEIAEGCVRPENVVGSYAVYGQQSGRVIRFDGTEVVDYGPGKFCHIYRPEWIAANGQRLWGEQLIVDGQLRITIPTTWLQSLGTAAFPLVLDPTFGYDQIGATGGTPSTGFLHQTLHYAPASSGTVTSVDVYVTQNGDAITCGIYDATDNPNAARLAQSAGGTTAGQPTWWSESMSLAITSGTNYKLAWSVGSTCGIPYDAYDGEDIYRAWTYSAGDFPDPFGAVTGSQNRRYSIRATYTESGGGTTIRWPWQQRYRRRMTGA